MCTGNVFSSNKSLVNIFDFNIPYRSVSQLMMIRFLCPPQHILFACKRFHLANNANKSIYKYISKCSKTTTTTKNWLKEMKNEECIDLNWR